jgi:TP901 family phage tail tape measure protein
MARRSVEIFIKGYNRANKAFEDLKKHSTLALRSLKYATVALGAATGAATAIAVQGTREYARFAHSMAEVSTMIRENVSANTEALSLGIRELAQIIPQSTDILSTALYDLLSASVPVSESMSLLKTSGKAAVAGMSDVLTAANLATGTMNALGIAFSESQKVFDIAFSTVRAGKVTFTELAGALGQVLPSASKMNASIEEVYGSIAFLTKNALSADMASVSLARAFDGLGEKAAKLEKMGVKVFGEAGEYVGIVRVIEQIAGRLAGLTEQAKVNVLQEMGFEIRAARAITVMANNLDAFRTTMLQVTDSAGAMEDAFDKMKDTLINQWIILKNNIKDLGITIGEEFGGAAVAAIGYVTAFVKDVNRLLRGAGGLRGVWEHHGDDVITIVKQLAAGIVNIMVEGMKGVGKVVLEYGRRPFEDLVFSVYQNFMEMVKIGKHAGKLITGNFKEFMDEIDRAREAREKQWADWQAMQEERMDEVLTGIAKSAAQAGIDLKASLAAAKIELNLLVGAYQNLNMQIPKTAELATEAAEAAGPVLSKVIMLDAKALAKAGEKARKAERERADDIRSIRQEITLQTIRNTADEFAARRAEIAFEAQAIRESLGNTQQAYQIANEWMTAMLQAEVNKRLEADKAAIDEKERAYQEARNKILAREKRVMDEIRARSESYREQSLELAAQANEQIRQSQFDAIQSIEGEKENAFAREQERIRSIADTYGQYTADAISLSRVLFESQKRGWMRTLANLIRYAAHYKAAQLEAQALEKLKQAGQAETHAQMMRIHASEMAAIGARTSALALERQAMGDIAGAQLLMEASRQAAVEWEKAMAESAVYEKQARVLQTEGAALMKSAAVVKSAGELAAAGLEMAADRADDAAKRQEKLARKEEQRLQIEQRIQQRILELEGRTGELRMQQLDKQIEAYQKTGVSTALLQRMRALEAARLAEEEGLAVTAGGGVAGITPSAAPTPTGGAGQQSAKNVVYQTVTFHSLLDPEKEEILRELAEKLMPYIEEVEERYRE